MTTRRASGDCAECGADLPKGRRLYCSTPCMVRAQDKKKTNRKPCLRCGGPKEYGGRGARYCEPCREAMGPIWFQLERERSRKKATKQREANGTPKRRKKVNEEGQVWCSGCHQYLARIQFPASDTTAGKLPARCIPCNREYHHGYRLKTVFGIDADEYHRLSSITGHRCAICLGRPTSKRLAVDHNHNTGEIRGLLCKRCNHGLLGAARDSIEMLERAICYLESPPARTGLPVVIHEDFVMPKRGKAKALDGAA